ncbi:hypothetical protein [Modicisalibacter sp. 'Wilcox']|uniref:hypothetical protein n=1 Tax=Modicisalibacter sp. 'Wilcox' TaxID=2679914 RepID=UPI0013D566B9|nr:hypothetical protein [Modicisalibacter sp. 'Wilcox']
MRDFLLLRRPLPRRTLVLCHVTAQLALLVTALGWLALHAPALSRNGWVAGWPSWVMAVSLWLLASVGVRLLAELLMLPHRLSDPHGPGAVMTRAIDRRPAVHDPEQRWVNAVSPVAPAEAVGEPRVTRREPSLKTRLHGADDDSPRAAGG